MTTKITQDTKGEAQVRAPVEDVAAHVGLDHSAGAQALHSVKRNMGRLFGTVRRASWKKS